MFFAPLQ